MLVDGDFKLLEVAWGTVTLFFEPDKINFVALFFGLGTLSGLLRTISGKFFVTFETDLLLP